MQGFTHTHDLVREQFLRYVCVQLINSFLLLNIRQPALFWLLASLTSRELWSYKTWPSGNSSINVQPSSVCLLPLALSTLLYIHTTTNWPIGLEVCITFHACSGDTQSRLVSLLETRTTGYIWIWWGEVHPLAYIIVLSQLELITRKGQLLLPLVAEHFESALFTNADHHRREEIWTLKQKAVYLCG